MGSLFSYWSNNSLKTQDWYISNKKPLGPEELLQSDKLFSELQLSRPKPSILSKCPNQLSITHTNILEIKSDVIINPANTVGLGCFVTEHKCLDNQIHRLAGPRLREACRAFLFDRQVDNVVYCKSLPVSMAMITKSFYLNDVCKYIVHVPGPVYDQHDKQQKTRLLLIASYQNSLDCVYRTIGKDKIIVFPLISSGVYQWPREDAIDVATYAITSWLKENSDSNFSVYLSLYTLAKQDTSI